jgi:transposase
MGKAYSIDLRERVVGSIVNGGLSCHQAAAQFDVGISTAILWVQCFRETGSVAPGRRRGSSGPDAEARRHRHYGQSWLAQEPSRTSCDPRNRSSTAVLAEILAGLERH